MPANLQQLKRRIKTAKNVSQIAKAMEMMSASKIKRAQTTVENGKPHAEKIRVLTQRLIAASQNTNFKHPYIKKNNSQKKLLIAVSPDRGLCGSLNTNLFKKILEADDKDTMVIAIGRKLEQFTAKMDLELIASFPMGTTLPQYSFVYQIVELINQYYLSGKVSEVHILYAEFTSFFAQTPTVKQLLPIEKIQKEDEDFEDSFLFEPSVSEILEALLPQYLELSLYTAILEGYTSEQVARMIAMQNAKNNAQDIANYLTLSYNKSRQERITNEILDLSNNAQI